MRTSAAQIPTAIHSNTLLSFEIEIDIWETQPTMRQSNISFAKRKHTWNVKRKVRLHFVYAMFPFLFGFCCCCCCSSCCNLPAIILPTSTSHTSYSPPPAHNTHLIRQYSTCMCVCVCVGVYLRMYNDPFLILL